MEKKKIELLFDENYRNKKIEELNSLDSSVEKIKFWYSIGLRWLELTDSSSIYDLKLEPFKFEIPASDYKQVNDWIIDNYLELAWGTLEDKEKKYLILNKLIEDFEKRFKEKPEKRTIRREINFVEDSFEMDEIPQGRSFIKRDSNKIFNASKSAFYNYIQKDEIPDISQVFPNVYYVLSLRNGFILGQFYHYLEDLYESPKKVPSKQKDIALTVQEQILMLQYLGLFEKINAHKTDTDKAAFLSALLYRHPQSVREIYTEGIYKIINKKERLEIKDIEKSLIKIHQLLISINLKEEASIVKAEIDSL
jgi:hypothetical protein